MAYSGEKKSLATFDQQQSIDQRHDMEEMILKLQSENQQLQGKVKELETRPSQNESYTDLLRQKESTDKLNQQILSQIGTLKEAIYDFKERERLNKKLLEDSRHKDETITKLRE